MDWISLKLVLNFKQNFTPNVLSKEAKTLGKPETAAVPCLALLEDFARREQPRDGKLLRFVGIDGRDAYNCTVEAIGEECILATRIESRPDALDAETRFYRECMDGAYKEIPGAPVFAMEDPALEHIGGEVVVSGVHAQWEKNNDGEPKLLGYRMLFYRGERLEDMRLFMQGPPGEKDIELLELPDGRIAVFTRPHGKIAFTIVNTLEELTPQRLTEATIIPGQFAEGERGGANKLRLLDEKTIGVLGHISFKDSAFHYCVMAFRFDIKTRTASPLRIIATRENFPPSETKKPWLKDVVFPGGLLEKGGDEFVLYAGLSDAANGTTIVVAPFGE
ncbi:MAG: DUF1861 family protein [bacterium]|nr:DUF1861 family protein [bacterium]